MTRLKRFDVAVLAIAMGCGASWSVADDFDGPYAGIGISPGMTRMEPDSNGTIYSTDDEYDSGGKIYLGYDITRRFSAEIYYSDLGEVTMNPSGSIDYRDVGAYGLYYLYRPEESREGLSLYAALGGGKMLNKSSGVPMRTDHDFHLMAGVGAEYGLFDGWALRANLDLYDHDAQMISFGVMKRFGGKPAPVVLSEPEPEVVFVPEPEPAPEPVPVPVVENPDLDGDGILNANDRCPDTEPGVKVDEQGCDLQETIVLEGVTFATNSATLVGESTVILDEVVATLKRYPEQPVAIAGYTDDRGAASYNQQLSERRATAVMNYLVEKGVQADRIRAQGYGESDPIADNATAEGRAKNRRVELQLDD